MNGAERIAQYLERAKVGLLAHYCSFIALGYPDVLSGLYQALAGAPGAQIPLVVKRRDGTVYPTPSVNDVLLQAKDLPGFGFGSELFPFMLRSVSVTLGDQLVEEGLMRKKVPLLQFVRHLRNASAHNNAWNFRPGEPQYPAQFRSFKLDSSMHGRSVFIEYLSVGDFLDLCDDMIAYLRGLP